MMRTSVVFVVVVAAWCWVSGVGALTEPKLEAKEGSIHLHAEAGDVHMHTSEGEATWTGALGNIASLQEQVRQLQDAMRDMMARTPADLEARLGSVVAENHALRTRVVRLEAKVSQQHEDTLLLLSENRELKQKTDIAQSFVQSTSELIQRWFDHFGFQPGWSTEIDTMVESEDVRKEWIAVDPQITETSCRECRGAPFYLHGPGGTRAGYDLALRTVNSYLRFRFPHRLPVDAFRRTQTKGRLLGKSLFVSGSQLRAESDTNCHSYDNDLCTGESISAAEVYVAPVRAAAPSNVFAPASQPVAVENTRGILDITDKLTVEAWVKCMLPPHPPPRGRTSAPVLTKNGRIGYNEDTYAMYQRWRPGRYDMVGFMFKLERASDDKDFGVQTAYKFDISYWYHVVGVYDGQDLIIYVNGVEEGRNTIGAVVAYTGPEPLVIGSNKHTNHGVKGSIHAILDEIAVWNRVLQSSEIAASTFVPIPDRRSPAHAAGQHNLTAYINFENPDSWFVPQREERVAALDNNTDVPSYVVPEVGPNQLNATSPNLMLVPSVNRSQHAALFYDEEQWLSLSPTVSNGNYMSFVPVDSLECTHDAGCPCDAQHLIGTTRVSSSAVQVLLPAGQYHVCHSFTGEDDSFWQQPLAPIVSSDIDPCFGIACGAHGSCNGGSCVCGDGFSGDQCEVAPPRSGDGTAPTQPLPACSSLPGTTETDVFFVLDNADAPATSGVSPALCVRPLSRQAAPFRAAAVVASPTNISMAQLTAGEGGGLSVVNDPHSATFATPLPSNTFEHVAVACLNGTRSLVEATLTPVPSSTLSRFISGAGPTLSETLENGSTISFVKDAAGTLVSITITAADGGTSFAWEDGGFTCAGLSVSNTWRLALLVR